MIATVVAALAVALGLVACGGGGGDASLGPDGDVAVTVGDAKITNGDIERRAKFLATTPTGTGTAPEIPAKDSKEYADLRRTAAEQLRDEKVFAILAKRCGRPCAVPKKEIDDQVTSIVKEQFGGSRSGLTKALGDRGISLADLEASLVASQQELKLTDRETAKVNYTEAQAKAYYEKNVAQYKVAAAKNLSHILVSTRAQALAIAAEATPENFADLAKARSIDPAAKTSGGDLGPVATAGLVPELQAAAAALKPGQVSKPLQSQFGWHLLLLRDIKARTKPFDEVKADILATQVQVAQAAAVQKWRDTVVKKVQDTAKYLNKKVEPVAPATTTSTTSTGAAATTSGTTTAATTTTTAAGTTTAGTATAATTSTAASTGTTTGPATP